MIRALLVALLFATPTVATQDGWPALYDVMGVAPGDVLNIRAEPDAVSDIIGTFVHNATDIEVIRSNDAQTWGQVNTGEGSGWVSLRFLARKPGHIDGLFPEITTCYGTEPFWSLTRTDGALSLDVAFDDREPLSQSILWETGTLNHRGRFSFRSSGLVGVLARSQCNDGMSDREFGIDIDLILLDEGTHLQGCCTIRPSEASR